MTNGGKRRGAGRKKIGLTINMRIEEELLIQIENKVDGKSRAEKIRNCLKDGLKNYKSGGYSNE